MEEVLAAEDAAVATLAERLRCDAALLRRLRKHVARAPTTPLEGDRLRPT